MKTVKSQLGYLNEAVSNYFTRKFLNPAVKFRLPALERSSNILTSDLLALLYYSNKAVQNCAKMNLLFTGTKGDFNFTRFAYAIRCNC